MRRAPLALVASLVVGLLGCRDYAHFEKHADASAPDSAAPQDGGAPDDGGAPGDAAVAGCVLPGLANLQANPDKPVGSEKSSAITSGTIAPSSVVLAHFGGLVDASAIDLV